MTRRIVFIAIVYIVFGSSLSVGQTIKDIDYSFKVEGLEPGNECYIAYHYGDKQFISDTLEVDVDGVVRFNKDEVNAGVYLFVLPGYKEYFEFIVNEPTLVLNTNNENLIDAASISGSRENVVYFDYLKFLSEKSKEVERINERSDIQDGEKNRLRSAINNELQDYKQKLVDDYQGYFVARLVKATIEPELDEIPEGYNEEQTRSFRFYNYRAHYFDNFDLSSNALMYSPVLHNRMTNFYNKLTVQHPDSLIEAVDYLIEYARQEESIFKYAVVNLLNEFATSNKICMDKVYFHIVKTYYLTGEADWVDEYNMRNLRDKAENLENNLCGNKALDFALPTPGGEITSLYEVESEYTVLLFWSTRGNWNKRRLENLKQLGETEDQDFKIVAVFVDDSSSWQQRIENAGVQNWVHMQTTTRNVELRKNYNAYSTPKIFLLDKDKKIVLKNVTVQSIRSFFDRLK